MKHIYFFITSIILLTTDVTAQVTLIAPSKMVRTGDSVIVELRAKSSDTLSTLQFTLSWDASVLSFGRVDTLGGFPPSAIANEFGYANISTGKLGFVWISSNNKGLYISDTLNVFKIVFKAIGLNGTNSPLQFVASPTQIKASNVRPLPLSVTTQEGNVKIGTTANDLVFMAHKPKKRLQLEQNKPNPFQNQTFISFSLTESDYVLLSVYDFKGRNVLEKKGFYSAGRHEIGLDTEGVLVSGFYVYSVKTYDCLESKVFIKN